MTTYKITIVMTADSNPGQWVIDAVDQVCNFNHNEHIIECKTEEVTE